MAIEMPVHEFETLVAEALDTIPPELAALIDNCVVLVEDDPPDDVRAGHCSASTPGPR